jgi:UDP-N-acetylmuramate--alanine ligase
VTESCEFDRSFHALHPATAIVNNVEADHLDCYGTLQAIVESFAHFARQLPPAAAGGYLLIAHEGAHREAITKGITAHFETFGQHPKATHRMERAADGLVRVLRDGEETLRWRPRMMGEHNALNATAAGVMALRLGASREAVEDALSDFTGLDRRQQMVGLARMPFGDVRVFDDYGHHPTEIRVTLKALREETRARRLLCVFQPHQHQRTLHLLQEFAEALTGADAAYIVETRDETDEVQLLELLDPVTLAMLIDQEAPPLIEIDNGTLLVAIGGRVGVDAVVADVAWFDVLREHADAWGRRIHGI